MHPVRVVTLVGVAGSPFAATRRSSILCRESVPTGGPCGEVFSPPAVPRHMQTTYDAVVALTDAFCRDHLTGEYRDLARAMTASLSRKRPSPLASGQPRTWACGIIHVLGQLNFLSDKASQPHMTMAEVCTAFGVGQSTASAKARVISDTLHTKRMDPTWMLKRIRPTRSLAWRRRRPVRADGFSGVCSGPWSASRPPLFPMHGNKPRLCSP
jgi:hypothetical protein